MPELELDTSGVGRFSDEDEIASWAIEAVRFANKNNIMRGMGDNTINPKGNTTKEQAIALVTRISDNFSEQ